MSVRKVYPTRAIRPGEHPHFPAGKVSESLGASYEPHEVDYGRMLARRAEAAGPGTPGRQAAIEEFQVLHEFKALLGARMLTGDEMDVLDQEAKDGRVIVVEPYRPKAEQPEQIQTTFLPPEGTSSMFPIPESVRRRMGYDPAVAARDEAMRRVEEGAAEEHKALLLRAILDLAGERPEVVTDDVWDRVGSLACERRVLGPVMAQAERNGWIVQTGVFRKGHRAENHARPQQVWRSVIYQGRASA